MYSRITAYAGGIDSLSIGMHATHAPPFVWRVWRIGRVNAFRPKGHGFDFRSSHHVGTLITSGVVIKNKFLARFSQYHPACKFSTFSVEVIDQCIRKMKRGKAPGLDRIEAEHLVHAHPRLCVLLSLLFNQMLMHLAHPITLKINKIKNK